MRLIRGAPGAGKTARVLQEFRDELRNGRAGLRIVVPTATLVRHIQHELARAGEVFSPSCVVSLNRFVAELAPGVRMCPDPVLRAIVRGVLRRLQPPEFSEVAEADGMVSLVIETIALFENAGAIPEKLSSMRRLAPHGRAFDRVWRAVAAAVRERGFASRTELVRAAAAGVGGMKVWMDGFVSLSPLETELVSALASGCALTLTLAESPATDEIRRLALRLGAEDRLLTGPSRRPDVTTVQAPSIEREADEIARRILTLHAEGTPFREMGIALRDEYSYASLFKSVFERFGIPARFYFRAPLRENATSRFLSGFVTSALRGWEFGATLDALRGHPGWGCSAAMDRLDFAAREAMPASGADRLTGLCEDDWLRKRLADCLALTAGMEEKCSPATWAQRLNGWASAIYQPGNLDPATTRSAVDTQRSRVAALSAWLEVVESASEYWAHDDTPISLEEFWCVAAEGIEAASIHLRDERRDVVHVMNVYEARQWDVSVLFVCGVTDREYPRRHPRNLLFPDAEIDALRKAGIHLRKASDLERDEEALFEALRTRARKSLVLSWPAHDASGKKVQSSRYVMRAEPPAAALKCRPQPITAGHPAGGAVSRIESPELLGQLAAHHQKVSLTALEELAQCRFRFFANRTLSFKDRPERPSQRLKPLVWGSILHQALEAWLKNSREGDFVPYFESAFDEACIQEHLPPGYRLEAERILLRETARQVSATERWSPVSSEAEVDVSLDFPGGMTVTGRIDRIDRLNDRECVIVDYKSSRVARVEKMVESSTKLQGPLYALAARERLGLKTVAMMYLAVREDKRFGWGEVPNANLGLKPMPVNWIEDAKARTIERISDFLAGAIHPEPTDREECRWCDFADACRYSEKRELVMIEGAGA